MSYYYYPKYVSVAEKRLKAEKLITRMRKKGHEISPIEITGRKITTTFWGNAWCRNLESYSDYESRLPRGRSYVCNGAVIDLKVDNGEVRALVSGNDVYKISIDIDPISPQSWNKIIELSSGEIGSLVELLQGSISKKVMEIVTLKNHGFFPSPEEIRMHCNCPDWAFLCKHLAAVLYGVGSRLDDEPEVLFKLRCVDPTDLVNAAMENPIGDDERSNEGILDSNELSSIFSIDIDAGEEDAAGKTTISGAKQKKTTVSKVKKSATKSTGVKSAQKPAIKIKAGTKKINTSSGTKRTKPKANRAVGKRTTPKAETKRTVARTVSPKTQEKTANTRKKGSSSRNTDLSDKKSLVKLKKGKTQDKISQSTLLNKSEVLEIRRAFKEGESKSSLARRFGSTSTTITNAIQGLKAYAKF